MNVHHEELPTLPVAITPVACRKRIGPPRLFDAETELFLSNAPTLPELVPLALPADEELRATLPELPRRPLTGWVIATVALCIGVLAGAFLAPLL